MTKNNNIPAIRFKGFTDEWEQRKFSELYERVSEKNDLTYGKDEIISVANMYFKPDSYITDPEYLRTYNVFHLGDIAFEGNKSKNFAHGRFVENTIGNGIVSHVFDVFRPITAYDLLFWKYAINNERIMGSVLVRCTKASTMMTNLVANDFLHESILVPSVEEQQRIGAFLNQLDDLITLHQRKYDKLTNVKKSMLEKMFPKNGSCYPEIRFKGFSDAWEQRKLDEFVSFFSGLTYSPADIRPAGTLVLRSSNVKDGEFVDADNVYVDPTVVNSENVRDGDIIVVVRNGSRALIGKHAEIKGSKPNTVIGAFMTGIRSEHPSFLNALLNTPRFDEEVEMNMGATINQITGYMFSKMEFMVPSSDEQDVIGDFFKRLDNLITLHQRELEKLKNIKKSMLEKMFV